MRVSSVDPGTVSATSHDLRGVAFFGGGSGGHIFPGIAVAQRVLERFPSCRVVFCPSSRAVEDKIFRYWPFDARPVPFASPGRSPTGWARYAVAAGAATRQARRLLRGRFEVAIGLGGYAALPGILAARSLGIPVLLLEQNRVAGRVNRLLAPLADAVAASSEGLRLMCGDRVRVTGNPLRREVLDACSVRASRCEAEPRQFTALVVGGSQGARPVNSAVLDALETLDDLRDKMRWIHVAGVGDRSEVAEAYARDGWEATVIDFASDLPLLAAQSDLVVSRAGGTTLAELAALGLPAILVPYPHHRDRHQVLNARGFTASGGGIALEEGPDLGERLAAAIHSCLESPSRLSEMAARARDEARPEAADAVVDLALELAAARGRRCQPRGR